AMCLTACGGGGGGDAPAPSPPPAVAVEACPVGDLANTAAPAINAWRVAVQTCGGVVTPAAPALTWEPRLAEAAQVHSSDMAANGFFAHTGTNGLAFGARVAHTGYTGT